MKIKKCLLIFLALAILVAMSTLAVGCKKSSPDDSDINATYTVVFDTDGAKEIASQTVKFGEKVEEPETPTKTDASIEYEFLGWYYKDKLWDFSEDVVASDIVLVAHWKVVGVYTPEYLPVE